MTKKQFKNLALAAEAMYLLKGAQTDAVTSLLNEKDASSFRKIQMEMALNWLWQAGFKEVPGSAEEIFKIVMAETKIEVCNVPAVSESKKRAKLKITPH